jgi:hypothetical protein
MIRQMGGAFTAAAATTSRNNAIALARIPQKTHFIGRSPTLHCPGTFFHSSLVQSLNPAHLDVCIKHYPCGNDADQRIYQTGKHVVSSPTRTGAAAVVVPLVIWMGWQWDEVATIGGILLTVPGCVWWASEHAIS